MDAETVVDADGRLNRDAFEIQMPAYHSRKLQVKHIEFGLSFHAQIQIARRHRRPASGEVKSRFEIEGKHPQQGLLIGKAHMIGGARVQRRAQAPCAEMEISHVETGTNAERAFVLSESGQPGRKGKQTQ